MNNASIPTACPEGYFCPSNSSFYTACDPGTYCPVNSSLPLSCPGGYFCNATSPSPIDCPAGSYCSGNTSVPVYCPAGSHCPRNSITPTTCSPGNLCLGNSTTPAACPNRTYCPDPAIDSILCLETDYCPTNSSAPLQCGLGEECIGCQVNATVPAACTPCQPGFIKPFIGYGLCEPCPTGTHQSERGKTECIDCGRGEFANATGSANCTLCEIGTYSNFTGVAKCDKCKYAFTRGMTICFIPCEPLSQCHFHGKCVNETCICKKEWTGDDCSLVFVPTSVAEAAVATSSAAVAVASVGAGSAVASSSSAAAASATASSTTTSTASAAASKAGGPRVRSVKASANGLIALMVFLQQTILPIEHNAALSEVYESFKMMRVFQLNFGKSDYENGGGLIDYAHGIIYKVAVLLVFVGMLFYLPGKRVHGCCFEFDFKKSHFLIVYMMYFDPIMESIFESYEYSTMIILATLFAISMSLFVYFFVRPYVNGAEGDFRQYLVPGRGFRGLVYIPKNELFNQLKAEQEQEDKDRDAEEKRIRQARKKNKGGDLDRKQEELDEIKEEIQRQNDEIELYVKGKDHGKTKLRWTVKDSKQAAADEKERRKEAEEILAKRLMKEREKEILEEMTLPLAERKKRQARRERKDAEKDRLSRQTSVGSLFLIESMLLGYKRREEVPVWRDYFFKTMFANVVIYDYDGGVDVVEEAAAAGEGGAIAQVKMNDFQYRTKQAITPRPWEVKYFGWLRSRFSHYFNFIKLTQQALFIAFAVGLDGEPQLVALQTLLMFYVFIIFILVPFTNPTLQTEVLFTFFLFGQVYLLLDLLRNPKNVMNIMGITIMQLVVVPLNSFFTETFKEPYDELLPHQTEHVMVDFAGVAIDENETTDASRLERDYDVVEVDRFTDPTGDVVLQYVRSEKIQTEKGIDTELDIETLSKLFVCCCCYSLSLSRFVSLSLSSFNSHSFFFFSSFSLFPSFPSLRCRLWRCSDGSQPQHQVSSSFSYHLFQLSSYALRCSERRETRPSFQFPYCRRRDQTQVT